MKFAALYVLKRASLFSPPSSRLLPGAIKTAEEPGSILTDITCERLSPLPPHRLFFSGIAQSVWRNGLGMEHPGKFHFTSEVVLLVKDHLVWSE